MIELSAARPPLTSFLACSPWERAPLGPFTPALCQLPFGCGTLFGIHTHLKWTRRGQFLSTPGVFSVLGEEVGGGGFGSATGRSQRECLAKSQILVEGNGSTAMFVNVLIVTDSQHGLEIFRRGQPEEGRRACWAFIPLFLPACLPYLFLSFPGRARLLAGSQTESGRMNLLRTLGAFFCKQALVQKNGGSCTV